VGREFLKDPVDFLFIVAKRGGKLLRVSSGEEGKSSLKLNVMKKSFYSPLKKGASRRLGDQTVNQGEKDRLHTT